MKTGLAVLANECFLKFSNALCQGLCLLFFTVLGTKTNAQSNDGQRTISGAVYTVENDTSVPLAGVIVKVKNEPVGSITDIDGRFSFTLSGKNITEKELIFSFQGMKKYSEVIGNKTDFTVTMQSSLTELNEVVITSSYGTKKLREEVVGSITTLQPENLIPEQPAVTFDELLEGQAAGVLVEINPNLGGAASIDIRGQGSLTPLSANSAGTSTQPLIIVDGIILSEEITLEGNSFFDASEGGILSESILNPLARVGVFDIESINILKDAAAVGIYGADAANGVIIITTKSGKPGKLSIDASVQAGLTTAFNKIEHLSGEQYQEVLNTFFINNGEPENASQWDGTDTDWFDLLNKNGSFQRYQVSASGGIGTLRLRASAAYQRTDEAQRENSYDKLNTSLSLDYGIGNLDVRLTLSPSWVIKNSPNTLYAYAVPPTLPLFDDEGNYSEIDTYGNPVAVSKQNKNEAKTSALLSSLRLDYAFHKSLMLSTQFGIDASNKVQDRFFSGANGTGVFNNGDRGRRLIRNRDTRKWNWNGSLKFMPESKGSHSVDAIAGIELRSETVDFDYARGNGFTDFAVIQPVELAKNQDFQSDQSKATARSVFSQANYSYDDRYYASFSFRVDQSSVFGDNNDIATNGGLGVGWNISNESFWKRNTLIDFLRLRASYGRTGNSRIGTYSALGLYNLNNQDRPDEYATIDTQNSPNVNLGWEVNTKFNIGLDVNFLQRFKLTTEFFNDNIEDQIVERDIIAESGYSSAKINGASMYNRGLEITLSSVWFETADFSWQSRFNYTRIRNKINSLTGLESDFSQASRARAQRVGFPTSTIWGFQFAGVDPATGRELFEVNGEIFDAAGLRDQFDRVDWEPLGDSQPDFFGGFNNTFRYKSISLGIIFTYTAGSEILVRRSLVDGYNDLDFRNPISNVYYDAWFEQGDIATFPRIVKFNRVVSNSSKYVYDNSHIKLRSINLSYSMPFEKENTFIKLLNVTFNASNLHYWFRERTPKQGNGIAQLRNAYPEMRTYTLGLSATF